MLKYDYQIGVAREPLPLPAAGTVMQGYADDSHKTDGSRDPDTDGIWARAFYIANNTTPDAGVFIVVADLWAATSNLRAAVQAEAFGYTSIRMLMREISCLQLLGTHTHSGPSGFAGARLHQHGTGGYNAVYTHQLANSIAKAMNNAYESKQTGRISYVEDVVEFGLGDDNKEYNFNRAMTAFNWEFPDRETLLRDLAGDPVGNLLLGHDNRLRQLNFFHTSGDQETKAGLINWFAMHPTCLDANSKVVSGDHKGYAALECEKDCRQRGSDRFSDKFIAAFANANCGDISPNASGFYDDSSTARPPEDRRERMRFIGDAQKNAAIEAFEKEDAIQVTGSIEVRHGGRVDFTNIGVGRSLFADQGYLEGRAPRTWTGAIGLSMLGGSPQDSIRNDSGLKRGIREAPGGVEVGERWLQYQIIAASTRVSFQTLLQFIGNMASGLVPGVATGFVAAAGVGVAAGAIAGAGLNVYIASQSGLNAKPIFELTNSERDGHLPKPITILTEDLAPEKLPIQILRIGNVIIPSVPAEMTSSAGAIFSHQVKLQAQRRWGENEVIACIPACYANEYSGYITTPWEYDAQYYEGASTLFGPFTLDAYISEFSKLIR